MLFLRSEVKWLLIRVSNLELQYSCTGPRMLYNMDFQSATPPNSLKAILIREGIHRPNQS